MLEEWDLIGRLADVIYLYCLIKVASTTDRVIPLATCQSYLTDTQSSTVRGLIRMS